MKPALLVASVLSLSLLSSVAHADAYDYCLTWRSWESGGSSGTTKCGYVKKDDPTCRLNTTSSSATGIACWEQGSDMVALGCTVYNFAGNNLLGDIQYCNRLWPDQCTTVNGVVTCTRTWDFSYMATPDNGDGN